MSKFCVNCGNQLDDNAAFCGNCGAAQNDNQSVNSQQTPNHSSIQSKNIVLWIVLDIITCGICGIVWFINITDDANTVSGDYKVSGGMAFLYTLITCGIYGIYWYYKMGKKLYEANQARGIQSSDNSLVYLLLGIFGLGIISYCLIQSELNKLAEQQ